MVTNPYASLSANAFWKSGVAGAARPVPAGIYLPKWKIAKSEAIATFGSCFAQHIGRRLAKEGYTIIDVEPAHDLLSPHRRAEFGYGIYSARYCNIYTVRQLRQLIEEALDGPCRQIIWRRGDGFVDGLRPNLEPEPFKSDELVIVYRERYVDRVRALLEKTDILVYTLGLTEGWEDLETGSLLPIVPGTRAGGDYNSDRYVFRNFNYTDVIEDFLVVRERLKALRPGIKFLITVSPVPLVATAAGCHVQVSTIYSKSVLRAVAGELADRFPDIDYFPSYEIITSPWSGQCFYKPDLREVTEAGVETVMQTFMAAQEKGLAHPREHLGRNSGLLPVADDTMVICDEVLLEALGR